jgi:hypothetical protein
MTDPRILREILSCYGEPNHVRSTAELAITVLPLVALWTAAQGCSTLSTESEKQQWLNK